MVNSCSTRVLEMEPASPLDRLGALSRFGELKAVSRSNGLSNGLSHLLR
jgi:hypothetical protein